jgi:hypothetical protein
MAKDVHAKVSRSTRGLSEVLFEQIEGIRELDISPVTATAITRLVNSATQIAKLELAFAVACAGEARLPEPVMLGLTDQSQGREAH